MTAPMIPAIDSGGYDMTAFDGMNRLLKNAHLLRCAANLIARRISIDALLISFCVPCI
jgi:hypothetical protein